MKKPFILLSFICLTFFSFTNGEAQLMSNSDPLLSPEINTVTNTGTTVDETKINSKAVKNFHSTYKQVSYSSWSILKDNSQLCVFQISSVKYRAFYDPNGSWSYTVSSYDGKELDKDLQKWIRDIYFDVQIVYVDQVDLKDNRRIYIVEVQDEKSIKKIRIEGEDMEVISNFSK
jgi:hypothetical protein